MGEHDWLTERFEAERPHLHAVAYRLLGSRSEADDAVQDSWLRLSRSDTSGIENLGGWLTTVVARVCLDMLRARGTRREESLDRQAEGAHEPEPIAGREAVAAARGGDDPEHEALLADAVGLALLVVLDALNPAERLAFVLHDFFDLPFDAIAPIVDRSPTATRQLASRARRRVRGQGQQAEQAQEQGLRLGPASAAVPSADPIRQRVAVTAFLAAARAGDFDALLALLAPDVVCRADRAAAAAGAPVEIRGASAVAQQFSGRAQGAQAALVDGAAGAVWAPGGQPRVVFAFTVAGSTIVAIDMVADPARLAQLDLRPLDG
jgi:RNA polymerase sigma-70 factor (ECF subfamily)